MALKMALLWVCWSSEFRQEFDPTLSPASEQPQITGLGPREDLSQLRRT